MRLLGMVPMIGVADIERARSFYEQVLGMQCISEYAPEGRLCWCHLERDRARLMMTVHDDDSEPVRAVRSRSILYFYVDDVTTLAETLRTAGIEYHGPDVTFYQRKELRFTDTEGFTVIVAQDTEEQPADCEAQADRPDRDS